jgi:hypothetical protein
LDIINANGFKTGVNTKKNKDKNVNEDDEEEE